MNKNNIRVIAFVLLLTCSLLITGCSSTEDASLKENVSYKITWSKNGNNHELTFTPNDYKKYIKTGGDKIAFYFDNSSEFKEISVMNGTCIIITKDKTVTIISGDFVIEPIEGE